MMNSSMRYVYQRYKNMVYVNVHLAASLYIAKESIKYSESNEIPLLPSKSLSSDLNTTARYASFQYEFYW